jgi:hypothetical protein
VDFVTDACHTKLAAAIHLRRCNAYCASGNRS